jgi:hypothetical protein
MTPQTSAKTIWEQTAEIKLSAMDQGKADQAASGGGTLDFGPGGF